MTAYLRIVPRNDHLGASLLAQSGASVVTGFEATNTLNRRRGPYLRTASASDYAMTWLLPSARTVSHMSLWAHQCHAGTIKVELFSDAAATTPATPYAGTGGFVSATPYTLSSGYQWSDGSYDPNIALRPYYLWFSPTSVRSYKITFSGSPTPGYWRVGYIFLGKYFQFTYASPDWNYARGVGHNSDGPDRTQGGSNIGNLGEQWATVDFNVSWITAAERPTLLQIAESALTAEDVVVSARAGDGTIDEAINTVCGTFSAINTIGRASVNRDAQRFQVQGI